MKITLNISAQLLREARTIAARERTTLSALVEQGLRKTIARRERRSPFRLRNASFKGNGLHSACRSIGREGMLTLIYQGRGA